MTDGALGALHALAHVFRMGADSKRCRLDATIGPHPIMAFFFSAQSAIQQRRKAPLRRFYVLQSYGRSVPENLRAGDEPALRSPAEV